MSTKTLICISIEQTQRLAYDLGKLCIDTYGSHALVVTLRGELGSGKTTFVQGFATGLGVVEPVKSPTFVIMKSYDIFQKERRFYHIDCYRTQGAHDLLDLGWKEIQDNAYNIVALEWPERVEGTLFPYRIDVFCEHMAKGRKFTITEA